MLGEIVRKEDMVDSEYLTTLLILVAKCVAHLGRGSLSSLELCFRPLFGFGSLQTDVCLHVFSRRRASYEQWESSYESLSELVVPRSSR